MNIVLLYQITWKHKLISLNSDAELLTLFESMKCNVI